MYKGGFPKFIYHTPANAKCVNAPEVISDIQCAQVHPPEFPL